ncbi:MAG: lysophospholipid acyltransferase family protein [Bacteroidales bacterium]|nr:lysophospholipid acyltransferase family protein [Bacteroidales bacterium]
MPNKNNGEAEESKLPLGVSRNGRGMDRLNIFERVGRRIIRGFSHLPMIVLYVFSDFVYFLLYWVVGYRQKVVRKNLITVFPNKTDKERLQIERKFYRHLSDYFFETIKSLTISDEELVKRLKVSNIELINDLLEKGKSVFLYAPHFGNWEWFTVLPLLLPGKEIHCFYQKQGNRFANYLSVESRTRRNIAAAESHHGFRYTYECIRKGIASMTLVIGDQCPHRTAQKIWLPFCGQDTPFLAGPEHIARKLDIALVYPSFVGYKSGYYEVDLHMIAENPRDLPDHECTSRFAALIEDDLRRIPQLWLWSHRRWKLKHEDFPDVK